MLSKFEIDDIKQRNDIIEVISRYVVLKKKGANYEGLCPFHGEKTPSFVVSPAKRIFKCYGCGKAGDVIDFLTSFGKTFKEALTELGDPNNTAGVLPMEYKKAEANVPAIVWTSKMPPQPFVSPNFNHYRNGIPNAVYTFRNIDGDVMGYTCRFNLPNGKKDVLPYVYATDGSRDDWRWMGFSKPRPLYNLPFLQRKDLPVLLVEGEKTADAAAKYFPHLNCLTWIGGAENVHHADFSPLFGKQILYWPDNDKEKPYVSGPHKGEIMPFHLQPGNKAMLYIDAILKDHCPDRKWIKNPEVEPCGWDVADALWTTEEATVYLENNIFEVPVIPASIPEAEIRNKKPEPPEGFDIKGHAIEEYRPPVSNTPPLGPPPGDKNPSQFDEAPKDGGFFRFLGYQKEGNGIIYHFYTFGAKSVVSLTPGGMTKPNLLQLAPMEWWEKFFPGRRTGFEVEPAQNWLINKSTEAKVFNTKWIRGRGAWLDDGRVVVHAGDRLIVDNVEMDFKDFNSKYVYEIGDEMGFKIVKPLTPKQAEGLVEILDMINWERSINSYLLAGWCVIAPICGALEWRPHIWITGGAGTGKSWIFNAVVRRILGEAALSVQGETSEPGLRQTLRHDALPVVFDEAEANDRAASVRMQNVLSLMRSSSTNDSGILAKGTAGGAAKTYRVRSVFAFASIAVQIKQQSDRTRITIIGVREVNKQKNPDQWKNLVKKYDSIITDEYCAKFRARSIEMLPKILKNAKVFSNAAAAELGQQRAGDQIGTLLAGAYSLRKNGLVTYDDAVEFIRARDWSEERSQAQTRDELKLMAYIMNQLTRLESSHGTQERTIGELVRLAAGTGSDIKGLDNVDAQQRLNRLGIKTLGMAFVCVCNDHEEINKMLRDTPWAINYNKILARLDGAVPMDATRFGSGVKERAIKIPYNTIFNPEQIDAFATTMPAGNGIVTGTGFSNDDLPF